MYSRSYVIAVLIAEIILFAAELILSVTSQKNRKLHAANHIDQLDFITLENGYRTSISIFRMSLFISVLLLVILGISTSFKGISNTVVLSFLALILTYMVSLLNVKTFLFYNDYFIVSSPFNPFSGNQFIEYNTIKDFRLYRALYNSYYLKIDFNEGKSQRIQFSGSALPRNDLVIRVILNTVTGLNKNFQELSADHDC